MLTYAVTYAVTYAGACRSNLSETSAPMDLTQLCLKHNFPPISNVVDMTFSVYGDLLLLLLQVADVC